MQAGKSVCPRCGREFAVDVRACPMDGREPILCPSTIEAGMVVAGRYHLAEKIAFGGWGVVFRARDRDVGEEVAVKILMPQHLYQPASVRRFLREQRIVARLDHPHVVSQRAHGRSDHGLFIVMELLRGRALSVEIHRKAPMSPVRTVRIAAQICSGLQSAHDCGVVHRDLKPDNIFLCAGFLGTDFVKVMDFGIAKAHADWDSQSGNSHTPRVYGTPYYVSPEQACANDIDGRSDLYSLGVVVFEMLTGDLPFPREAAMLTMQRRVDQPAPYLLRAFPSLEVPSGLCDMVAELLERDPERRPASAHEAHERFLAFDGPPEDDPTPTELPVRRPRPHGRTR